MTASARTRELAALQYREGRTAAEVGGRLYSIASDRSAHALAIQGVQSGVPLGNTGLTAGQPYAEMADVLLQGLAVRPD